MLQLQREMKVLVVGSRCVGKTCLIKQFCRATYSDEYTKTMGVDFMEKVQRVGSEDVKLMLWDTAGQEGFTSITRSYYKGAEAAVLIFSTTDRASFEALPAWRDKVLDECGDVAMALLQNKVDLIEQSAVSSEEVEAMARRLNLRLYRGCVREDLNVESVFTYLVELADKKANRKASKYVDSSEKPEDSGAMTPRSRLSMSESIRNQTQQKKQQPKKYLDCLLM